MQSNDKITDKLSEMMMDMYGAVGAIGQESKTLIKSQAKSFLSEMDFVSMDEYRLLLARVEKLEKKLNIDSGVDVKEKSKDKDTSKVKGDNKAKDKS